MSAEVTILERRLKELLEEGRETDYIMPLWLPFIPQVLSIVLILVIIALMIGMIWHIHVTHRIIYRTYNSLIIISPTIFPLPLILAFYILAIMIAILVSFIYVLYKWIDRRNKHFRRVRRLHSTIIEYLRAKGIEEAKLIGLKELVKEAEDEEMEKSCAIWIILTFIFYPVIFYIYHFLNKDFYKHERRELRFYARLEEIIKEKAPEVMFPEWSERIPDRNTIIYVVLSLITLGLFTLYWVYTLTRDPNEHFKQHRKNEVRVVEALEKL